MKPGLFAIRAVYLRGPVPSYFSKTGKPRFDMLTAVKFEAFPATLHLQCTVVASPVEAGPSALKLLIRGTALGTPITADITTSIDHIEVDGGRECTQLFAGDHELDIVGPGRLEFWVRQNDGSDILERVMRVKAWVRPAPPANTQPPAAA